MTTPAISIERISKEYKLGSLHGGYYRTLRESLSDLSKKCLRLPWKNGRRALQCASANDKASRGNTFWALRDVTFDVQPGDVVGVIGRNGAGKSTLLKVLSRITQPTSGRAWIRGRVGSLLEVGTGFHHELSGRENIYLSGAILGMTHREIDRQFDAIVDFAGIEKFLDTPVKRYSSGMFVRLAFAVASHLEPEILIVDEVLAVGDAAFQRKCLGHMNSISRSGRTVLFVSHNMSTIINLCNRVAVLAQGRLETIGDVHDGVRHYLKETDAETGGEVDLRDHPNRRGGCDRLLSHAWFRNSESAVTNQVLCGESVVIDLELDQGILPREYYFAVGFDDNMGRRLITLGTYLTDDAPEPNSRLRKVRCHLDEIPLAPGRYGVSFNAGPREFVWNDFIDQALWIDVHPTDYYGNGKLPRDEWGPFVARSRWSAFDKQPRLSSSEHRSPQTGS